MDSVDDIHDYTRSDIRITYIFNSLLTNITHAWISSWLQLHMKENRPHRVYLNGGTWDLMANGLHLTCIQQCHSSAFRAKNLELCTRYACPVASPLELTFAIAGKGGLLDWFMTNLSIPKAALVFVGYPEGASTPWTIWVQPALFRSINTEWPGWLGAC